jgi:hypothetical protein
MIATRKFFLIKFLNEKKESKIKSNVQTPK